MLGVLALSLVLAQSADKPKLIVMELSAGSGVDEKTASALSDALAVEVKGRGFFDPVTPKDVQTLLGLERQKQLLGCGEDSTSCMAELAGALGGRYVLSGTLSKLGDAYQLTMQMVDSQRAQAVGRTLRLSKSLEALRSQLPWAIAEATGTPLPPPPSRVLPYTLVGVGALAVVLGGGFGIVSLTQEAALGRELDYGDPTRTNPPLPLQHPRSYYQEQLGQLHTQERASALAVGVGAALLAAGLLLNPPEVGSASGVRANLVLAPGGLALVGSWP